MLESERLILRPMLPTDFSSILRLFSDPNVMAAFDQGPLTVEQSKKWFDDNLMLQKSHGYSLFAAVLKQDQAIIGNCGLTHYKIEGKQELEIGYDLHSDYWGQRLATEAATAVRDYAMNILKKQRLIGLVRQTNVASQRVLEKIGMYKEKELILREVKYWLFSVSISDSSN